jgi:hypothetical protein
MKALLLLLLLTTTANAQTINVDSLERKGYAVRIHKPSKHRVIRDTVFVRDTVRVYLPVLIHDTVRTHYYSHIERPLLVEKPYLITVPAPTPPFQYTNVWLIGHANISGYSCNLGGSITIGRVEFYMGLGIAYQSLIKLTKADLQGMARIKLF